MHIRALDAADPAELAAWHASHHEAHVLGQDYPAAWTLEEMRAEFLGDRPGEHLEPYGGWVDGEPVVTGLLELPLKDNLDVAKVDVTTRPDARRRGLGSVMLEHLTARAVAHGRSVLQVEASWPYDAPADGTGIPNVEFLLRHGFTSSLVDVKRVLDLPVDEALLDRLAAECAPYHADYRLRYFVGPVPEDLLEDFGLIVGSLVVEAPQGELHLEAEVFDAERIRADEAVMAAAGRVKHTTVAVAPDGGLAAYTELAVPAHDPGRVYQWGTLVRSAHRGRRLGMATKVHNLRRLQAAEPDRTLLMTWNAEVNAHMVAVNEALGFRPVGRLGEFQKVL
jgi:GNAT superfamily N-acetyltransferase